MKQKDSIKIDPVLAERFKQLQGTENYLSSSTIRFWLNYQTEGYAEHWHLDLEMIIPIENNYTVIVGQNTYVLSPGDILIIPPGEAHQLISPGSGMRLIYIAEQSILSNIRGYSLLTSYLAQPIVINQQTCPQIYKQEMALILELFEDYCKDDPLREFVIYPKLIHFFSVYAHYRMEQEHKTQPPTPITQKQRLQMDQLNIVLSYIDTHFSEDISLEQAADVAGFSKYHFSRLFKQHSGKNFYEYLCFRRIKSAETLLLIPNIPVTEVALRSGFSSLATFNRTFKKMKNCTPTRYRQLYLSPSSPFTAQPVHPRGIEHILNQTDSREEI
ncbi:MAG: AraC family transcriptional regulator [Roseburia sp.]|nr:AraC family transcriptional regulator [Roseburia sp.]